MLDPVYKSTLVKLPKLSLRFDDAMRGYQKRGESIFCMLHVRQGSQKIGHWGAGRISISLPVLSLIPPHLGKQQ